MDPSTDDRVTSRHDASRHAPARDDLPCVSRAGATRAARAQDARLTLVTDRRDGGAELEAFLTATCEATVDVVRLRRKPSDTTDLGPAVALARGVCDRFGALLLVDDDVAAVREHGADGVHLTRRLASVDQARATLGADLLVSRSIRSALDLADSADEDVDHVTVPVRPGAAGSRDRLHLVRIAAARSPHPWSAAGGVGPSTIAAVLAAGARRVVVGAALTRAAEPAVVAWQLRRALGRVH